MFSFSQLRHYQTPECFYASMSTTAAFELVQQFYHATKSVMQPGRSALALISHSRHNIDKYFG